MSLSSFSPILILQSCKTFLRGNCLKCRSCVLGIPTFQMVTKTFLDKGCNVTMTDEYLFDYDDVDKERFLELLQI